MKFDGQNPAETRAKPSQNPAETSAGTFPEIVPNKLLDLANMLRESENKPSKGPPRKKRCICNHSILAHRHDGSCFVRACECQMYKPRAF